MADKPRFVDPFLIQGPPPKQEPPPEPPPAAVVAPEPTPEPVTGELLDPKELAVSPGASALSGGSSASSTALGARRRQSLREKHDEKVREVDSRIRLKAANVVDMMMDAPKVLRPDEDEAGVGSAKPAGWSNRHFRVALDARLPDKDAPAYIRHASRLHDGAQRNLALEKGGKPSPALNCDIQVVMKAEVTYKYEILPAKDE